MHKKLTLLALLVALLPIASRAQMLSDYSVSVGTEEFSSIASADNLLGSVTGDGGSQGVPLPFSFAFGETTFDQGLMLMVRADGYLYFITTANHNCGTAWTATSTDYHVICPMAAMDGTITDNGAVYALATTDDNGDGVLIVEYQHLKRYNTTNSDYTFQVRLHANGNISAVYGDITPYINTSVNHTFFLVNTPSDKVCLTGSWSEPTMDAPAALPDLTPMPEAGTVITFERPTVYCPRVSNLQVTDITSSEATLSWTGIESANGYRVSYADFSEETDDTTFTLSDLDPSTAYTITVQSLCDDDMESAPTTISFLTACLEISVADEAYTEGFEDWTSFNPCWKSVMYDYEAEYWSASAAYTATVATDQAHSGTQSLRLRSYNNTEYDYDYDYYTEDERHIVYMPALELPVNAHQMSFWLKIPSNTSTRMAVGVSNTQSIADTTGFTRLMTIRATDAEWHQYSVDLNAYSGTAHYITFYFYATSESYSDYYAYIDDIHIEALGDCYKPSAVSVSDLVAESATISWVEENEVGTYRIVINGNEEDPLTVSGETSTSLTLEANTEYTVAVSTLCSDEFTDARTVSFRTPCLPIGTDELPWVENFDELTTGGSNPTNIPCMTVNSYQGSYYYYPYVNGSTRYGNSGNSLYFYAYTGYAPQSVVMPLFENAVNELQLSFYSYIGGTSNGLVVGTMSNPTDESTFEPFDTIFATATSTWEYQEVRLTSYEGDNNYIAIRPMAFTGSATTMYVDNLTVGLALDCARISSVEVSDITSTQATLTLTDPEQQNSYRVELICAADTNTIDIYTTTYTVEDLHPATFYTVNVYTLCGSDLTTPVSTSFYTGCDAISTLPWHEGFDNMTSLANGAPNCWGHPTTDKALALNTNTSYVYGGTGKSLAFTHGNTSTAGINLAVLPEFSEPISNLEITFWSRPENNTSYTNSGTFEVGYVTDAADASTFVSISSMNATDFEGSSTSIAFKFTDATFANAPEGARIAFRHTPVNYNYYWYVDDIDVHTAPACARPTSVAVSDITPNGATLTINGGDETNFRVVYTNGTDTTTLDIEGNTTTLENLNSNTAYTLAVYTLCDDEPTAGFASASFRTSCGAETLPWTEGFESYTGASYSTTSSLFTNSCWSVLNSYSSSYPYVTNQSSYTHSGSQALYLQAGSSAPHVVVLPNFESNPSEVLLTLWLYYSNSSNSVEVGYMSNPSDASTFVAVQTLNNGGLSSYIKHEVLFPSEATGRIALRFVTTYSYGATFYLDDITVENVPACMRPTSVEVSSVDQTTATLEIEDYNELHHYYVAYGTDSIEVNGTTATLTDLTAGTNYSVRVYTVCEDGSVTADYTSAHFTTQCVPYTIPYSTSFEDDDNSETPNCWINLSGKTYARNASSGNSNGIHSGSQYLDFRGDYRNMVALPTFDQEISGLQVRFWTRPENFTNDKCGTFHVGYLTNVSDTTTFVSVASWAYNSFTTAEEKEVSMAGAPEGAVIAFLHDANADNYYWYVDDVNVEPIPACARPQSVEVSNIATTSADLTVADAHEAGNYVYRLYQGTTLVDSASFTGYTATLSNLEPSSSFTLTVATLCDDGSLTATVSTSFRTECATIANLPWSDDFEGWTTGSDNANPCWGRLYHSSSDYTNSYPFATSAYAYEGSNALALSSSYDDAPYAYSVSFLPEFDADINTLSISFWYRLSSSYSADYVDLAVGVSSTDADTTTFTRVATLHPTTTWAEYTVDLSAYTGNGNRIAILQRSINGDEEEEWDDWDYDYYTYIYSSAYGYLDNISVSTSEVNPPVGIDAAEQDAHVSLYPNPATTSVSIEFEGSATINVVDMNGRQVLSTKADSRTTLDVSGLAKGAYFVRVISTTGTAVSKLVVK